MYPEKMVLPGPLQVSAQQLIEKTPPFIRVLLFVCVALMGVCATGYANVLDADSDGVVDTVDIDDDNDGIPDFIEIAQDGADRDSDQDGMPDRLDLDSDNDGILDLAESGVFMLAAYPSVRVVGGRLRTNVGLNGYSDFLETAVDNGKMVYQVLNSDHSTGDMVPDFLDLDSDNDGLLDLWEAGVPVQLDSDSNGRIDASPGQVGADGILDSIQLNNDNTCCDFNNDGAEQWTPRNTDGGDLPDFQDLDSDNDGIYDLVEAGGRDLDGDGRIDGFQDDLSAPDGVDDAFLIVPLVPPDSDNNGIPDVLDYGTQHTGAPSTPVVSTPEQPSEETPEESSEEPSDPTPVSDSGEEPTPAEAVEGEQDENASPAVISDDAVGLGNPIETGLNGGSGCTITSSGDPLFPLLALLAVSYLLTRRRKIESL